MCAEVLGRMRPTRWFHCLRIAERHFLEAHAVELARAAHVQVAVHDRVDRESGDASVSVARVPHQIEKRGMRGRTRVIAAQRPVIDEDDARVRRDRVEPLPRSARSVPRTTPARDANGDGLEQTLVRAADPASAAHATASASATSSGRNE